MGGFCGRFITGHVAELLSWRGAYVTLATVNFIGALLVVWLLPPSRCFVPNRNVKGALSVLWKHLHNQRLLAACAVGFCVLFSMIGVFTYVNLYLADSPFKLSAADLANVFCVYLAGVVVTPVAGRFIVRFGFLRSLQAALAIFAAGLLLTLLPSLTLVIVGLAVFASGMFVCQSITMSFIADSVSEGRSLATGLYNMAYYAGGAVGTWVAGLAYEAGGWRGSVLAIFLIQVLAAAIASVSWRKPKRCA